MCGIVGVVSLRDIDAERVATMRDLLEHRGPDHAGLWSSADGRTCLAHRRLSIIDLDPRSNQPMVSRDGRFVVSYNGEIYNFRTLRAELAELGVPFSTESDTEVLLEAWRAWGDGFLDRLSGMYALAIWDDRDRRLLCARDRAGEKPFYYAVTEDAFVFASEPKALLDWPGLDRSMDYEALIDFLTLGYVADPRSIWSGVRKLAPARSIVVHAPRGRPLEVSEPTRYWSLPFRPAIEQPSGEAIRATLLAAADEMAVSDVPLGTFLSGGVDSSSVTAALSLSGHEVRSFTIGFEEDAYDERRWARAVAQRYQTDHTEAVVVPTDVETVIDTLGWHYDEPFNDYSNFPTYHLCREARRDIIVALSGDGADEIFGGYRRYQRLARRAQIERVVPGVARRAIGAGAQLALPEGSHWRRTLRQYGLSAHEFLTDALCTGFPVPLLREVARGPLREALRHYDVNALTSDLLREAPPEEVGLVNAARHLDLALTLPGDMLVKVDRASMAVSLETRPLFLHRSVMELAAGIDPSALATPHAAKVALREAVRPWLPDDLIDRRKQGFAMPLPEWLGGDSGMAARIHAARSNEAIGELLDLDRLEVLAEQVAGGTAAFAAIIHSVFVLDQWMQHWAPTR